MAPGESSGATGLEVFLASTIGLPHGIGFAETRGGNDRVWAHDGGVLSRMDEVANTALAKSVGQPCARKSHARLEEGAPVGQPGEDTQAPPTERGGNSYGLATATSDRALLYRPQLGYQRLAGPRRPGWARAAGTAGAGGGATADEAAPVDGAGLVGAGRGAGRGSSAGVVSRRAGT
jgi:hypothetical protein